MEERQKSRIIHFGSFEVNPRTGELLKDGTKIRVQQQPFELLITLLSRPGDVVTREELRQRLWPQDTFVDFEHSLNAAIKRLRDVLGDSAEHPRFVETLAKRGYRFVAPVSLDGSCLSESSSDFQDASRLRKSKLKKHSWLVVALVAGVTATCLYLGRQQLPTLFRSEMQPPMKILPLTSSPGAESDAAFSPDGREVAFVSDESGTNGAVYVKLIGSEKPLRLTQGPGKICCPLWSPDGRYVVFGRCGGGDHGLFLVPALGGPERKLSPQGACADLGLSWSPDGKFLAQPSKDGHDGPWSISLLSLDTLERRKLTSPPGHVIGDHLPAFSPDSKTVAFRRISSPSVTDVYLAQVENGVAKRLTFDNAHVNGIAWTADGKSIVYASNRAGGTKLWKVPVSGGTPEPLAVGGEIASHPAISRQGNLLAYTQGILHTNIWRMKLSGSAGRAGPPERIIASNLGDGGPQYSPDGSRIAFSSARSGKGWEIWVCNSECSDPRQLTSFGVLSGSPRWSPDGEQIAFDSRPGEHSQIFVVKAQGGKPQQITSGDSENSVPGWSRDGHWIYFASNRTGGWQLWKVASTGGAALQVTKHGGFDAYEAQDGKLVYYTKEDPPGIFQVSPDGGEEREILDVQLAGWGYWGVTHEGIYFVDRTSNPHPTVKYYRFSTHHISAVAKLSKPPYPEVPDFAVSPDGQSILYSQVEANTNIMLVENFQ